VLVVAFNRPDLLERSLQSVLNQGAQVSLFVHIDGPRGSNELSLTEHCLVLVKNLKHENLISSQIEFHNSNLGCKAAMRCALDWFFSHNKCGLILEDDIVLLPGALQVTSALLAKFEMNKSIGQISLSNQLARNVGPNISYYLSNYPFIWGWATWKDRWETSFRDIRGYLSDFEESEQANILKAEIGKPAFKYWIRRFDSASKNQIDTWDFQWHFSNWYQGRKAIHFNRNFAINIGFDERATHTKVPLRLDGISINRLNVPRRPVGKLKVAKISFIRKVDRRISSRIFGVPHWFYHPLKYVKLIIERKL